MSRTKPYIPKGCDQQGRFPEALDAPPPAESCTEMGFIDEPPEQDIVMVVLKDLGIAVLLVGVIAAVVLGVLG